MTFYHLYIEADGYDHIWTKLFTTPISKYNSWLILRLQSPVINSNSNQYKLKTIFLDIAHHKLFVLAFRKITLINVPFRIKTMFGSSSPLVVCRRTRVLFVLFVWLPVVLSDTLCCVLFLFVLCARCGRFLPRICIAPTCCMISLHWRLQILILIGFLGPNEEEICIWVHYSCIRNETYFWNAELVHMNTQWSMRYRT